MKRGSKGGTRDDLGFYVRSTWEANVARYYKWLQSQGNIAKWEYEPCEFEFPVKRGNRTYKPDFRITENDGRVWYCEVKGYMDNDSRVKLKRMAKYHPGVKVIVLDGEQYRAIAKHKRLIPGWE